MLSIVVPVYNEDKSIVMLFEQISDYITVDKEILVVYDSDGDTTIPVVKTEQDKYSFPIYLVKNMFGKGALNAIVTGMRKAAGDMVLVMMADLSDGLDAVPVMYQKMEEEHYDLVCGSRYMKGGKQHGGPFLKGLFSRTAGLSLHFLTGIPTHDVTNSFKMYRKSMLDTMEIESNGGFEIGLEIAVKAYLNGYRITEVPAEWFDREEGESHFHMWKWMPHYLHWYLLAIKKTCLRRVRDGSKIEK